MITERLTRRPADARDREYLVTLNRRVYEEVVSRQLGSWDEGAQRAEHERKLARGGFEVLMLDGQDVGALWVTEEEDHLRIREIQIAPEHQRRGLGTGLLRELLREAQRLDKPVRLRVLEASAARRLYERLGFVYCGETATQRWMEAARPFWPEFD